MTNLKFIGILAFVVLVSAFTVNSATKWNVTEDYSIKFYTKKASGDFSDFVGNIQFDENNLSESVFDVQIRVASIGTGNWLKSRHAKGDNWLDADRYPTINFTSQSFKKSTDGYEVFGMLFLHGIKKEISIPFTFENNIFKGEFVVSRVDFEIGSVTGMSEKVGREIEIDISIPVVQ